MEILSNPWPWYVAGPLISVVLALLLLSGKSFGASSNFTTLCAFCAPGRKSKYFDLDWKANRWNLVVMLGAAIGAGFATYFLDGATAQPISEQTTASLVELGIHDAHSSYAPAALFGDEVWSNPLSILTLVVGGFLIGFGTRYAGGCTSGHAISGLSNLQVPSLIAVVGFFIGGLTATHFILPRILPWLADQGYLFAYLGLT